MTPLLQMNELIFENVGIPKIWGGTTLAKFAERLSILSIGWGILIHPPSGDGRRGIRSEICEAIKRVQYRIPILGALAPVSGQNVRH